MWNTGGGGGTVEEWLNRVCVLLVVCFRGVRSPPPRFEKRSGNRVHFSNCAQHQPKPYVLQQPTLLYSNASYQVHATFSNNPERCTRMSRVTHYMVPHGAAATAAASVAAAAAGSATPRPNFIGVGGEAPSRRLSPPCWQGCYTDGAPRVPAACRCRAQRRGRRSRRR